ncbi:hypothetical protein [Rhodanobacter sp. MP7CTX1]|uniref:hypothetical protein n=1 Tax=Rhodanobacter sp. MP7CTX1 TaxID=2723084 RepID=UPI00161C4E3B|nr:hypothetical protein [Rhodanobacter sp. MP7CTX1]MBB6189314.1 hypothetical protein [Rhodanobacter sp. MP7CTX1]
MIVPVGVAVLTWILIKPVEGKDVAGWLFPILSTFVGAFLVFRLQEGKDRKKERDQQINEVNRALLTLATQYNHLSNYERNLLSLYTSRVARLIGLSAIGLGTRFDARIETEKLMFLTYSGQAKLLGELSVEQERFDSCREVVAARCQLLLGEVHHLIEKAGINGQPRSEEILRKALGERVFGSLDSASEQVYYHVPATVKSLLEASKRLHALAEIMFPEATFIAVIPPKAQA